MLTKARRKYRDKFLLQDAARVALCNMVQNGMTNFVSFLANIMVGQLGTEQMSGVAIVNPLIFIFFLFVFCGLLFRVGIFTAQYRLW